MFYTAISGLNAFRQQLSVISDNIANSQTASYKAGDVSFAEVIASAGRIGSGVNIQNIALGWTQGAISNTGNANDFAITGAGFFIVRDTSGTGYTRDGQFSYNAGGSMVNADGMTVQGYAIDPITGIVSTTLSDITISAAPIPATATTLMSTTVNLNSGALVGATSDFSATVNTYDSLGNAVPLTMTFRKTAANTWSYTPSIPAATGAVTSAAGTLTFNATGALVAAADPAITFTLLGGATSPQTVTWDLTTAGATNGSLTQYAGTSALYNMTQNGTAQGQLTGLTSANSGIITASYSNGETRSLYQIALADFQNYDGLNKAGNNLYTDTPAVTGGPILGVAGVGRFGTMASGSLEASNVDMAKEMANMILAQRAYESCARVFTTESEMLKTVVNMS
jgi:flagellar hook protein FlgE